MNFRLEFSLSLYCFHSSVLVEVGGTGSVWWHEGAGGELVRLSSLSTMWIPPSSFRRPDLHGGKRLSPLSHLTSLASFSIYENYNWYFVDHFGECGATLTPKKLVFLRNLWYLILALPIHEHGMLPCFVFFRWLSVCGSFASIVKFIPNDFSLFIWYNDLFPL